VSNALLSEREVAKRLGIAVATVRRWRWSGRPPLPFVRIGGSIRYELDDIEEFIRRGRRLGSRLVQTDDKPG
jgi:excisionase family DNA binding protein